MPAPFPLVKLGSILVKQISKPIANFAKDRAKSSPFFRTYVCMPPAQFYNWCEIKLKMWVLNLGKPVNIPVLSEQMAIELGANLLGEGIVFVIAAGALIAEYNRSANKEAAKELARREELNSLLNQLQELYFRVEMQDAQLREMHRSVQELADGRRSRLAALLQLGKADQQDKEEAPTPAAILPMQHAHPTATPHKQPAIATEEHQQEHQQRLGVVLRAVQLLEKEFLFCEAERQDGVVTSALHYIENDVYRRPIAV